MTPAEGSYLDKVVRPLSRGRRVWVDIVFPQSFGANAPPTWGLGSVGPPAEVLYRAQDRGARLV